MTPLPDRSLWQNDDPARWHDALASYDDVVQAQGVASLPAHDRWYRAELPGRVTGRSPMHATHDELVRATEWKMARGVWRARNLVLVKGNAAEDVITATTEGLAQIPHPTRPIARIAELAGVGPATASAIASAAAPDVYPFFDELVADQIPGLGPVKFTHGYYGRYAEALRERAAVLKMTVSDVERALWAHSGGKAGRA